ncbi:MAG: hypothetical protein M1820_005265 [Bogoriella megaspora]|nr:MAG: hypothetical protein M1820_005265 [Bogoriella megaspora]
MSLLYPRQDFGLSCPSGGSWYSCGSGSHFVGCCLSEACANGCPAGNLKPASFDPAYYGDFPDQECSAGDWYTCNKTQPPFLGCCKIKACDQNTCPDEDLAAGFLSNNPALAASFSPTGGTTSTSTATSASSSDSTSATVASISTNTPTSSSKPSHHTPIGAIVGGAVGGFLVLVLAAGLLIYLRMYSSRSRDLHQSRIPTGAEKSFGHSVEEPPENNTTYPSPLPPRYSKVPGSRPASLDLQNSPRHKSGISELSAEPTPQTQHQGPVEMDTSGEIRQTRPLTQSSSLYSQPTQTTGLGINQIGNVGSQRISALSENTSAEQEAERGAQRTTILPPRASVPWSPEDVQRSALSREGGTPDALRPGTGGGKPR